LQLRCIGRDQGSKKFRLRFRFRLRRSGLIRDQPDQLIHHWAEERKEGSEHEKGSYWGGAPAEGGGGGGASVYDGR
jgi:hypothetical protein